MTADEDDDFALDNEGIECGPGCKHETMSRTELRRAASNPDTHMLMVYQGIKHFLLFFNKKNLNPFKFQSAAQWQGRTSCTR